MGCRANILETSLNEYSHPIDPVRYKKQTLLRVDLGAKLRDKVVLVLMHRLDYCAHSRAKKTVSKIRNRDFARISQEGQAVP